MLRGVKMNKTTKIKDFFRLGISLRKSKKGIELSFNAIIIATIALIVLVVVIATFTNLFGKEKGQIEGKIDALNDDDDDGILNLYDKCPCKEGDNDNDGCPLGTEPTKPKPKTC